MKRRIVLAALLIAMIYTVAPGKADAQCRRHRYGYGWRVAPRVIIAPPLPPPLIVARPRYYGYGRPYGYYRPHYGYRGGYGRRRW